MLFRPELIRAELVDLKTRTRRILKPGRTQEEWLTPEALDAGVRWRSTPTPGWWAMAVEKGHIGSVLCPWGARGDRLWVRERWRVAAWRDDGRVAIDYGASPELIATPWIRPPPDAFKKLIEESRNDCGAACADERRDGGWKWERGQSPCRWRSPLHMFRWAARLVLEIEAVKVERLQEITEKEARLEGVAAARINEKPTTPTTYRGGFKRIWEQLHGPGSWEQNPWVWAIAFRRLA